MSHQFDQQNGQQNSTTVYHAMDIDIPTVPHESSIEEEEDTKMDGSVNGQNGDSLPVGHSNGDLDKEASKNDANDVLT